jgi:hypothetical protein
VNFKYKDKFRSEFPTPKERKKVYQYRFEMMQPPRSPSFNLVDFHLWGHLKSLVYSTSVEYDGALHQYIFYA